MTVSGGTRLYTSIGIENFEEKTFTNCLKPIIGGCSMPRNTQVELLWVSLKLQYPRKFLPRSFPVLLLVQLSIKLLTLGFICSSSEQSSNQLCSLPQAKDQQPLQVWSLWRPVSVQGRRTPTVAGRGGARGGATTTHQEEEGI